MTTTEVIDGLPIEEYVPYTLEDASKLSALPERRLREWDASGLLVPAKADPNRRRPFSRWYNLRDIIAARIICHFRGTIPDEELRRIQPWVRSQRGVDWQRLRILRENGHLRFLTDDLDVSREATDGSLTFDELRLVDVADSVRSGAERLRRRDPSTIGRISRHRYIMQNAWVIDGTRVPTKSIWDMRDEGFSDAEILQQFPMIEPANIRAAIEHEERSRQKGAA